MSQTEESRQEMSNNVWKKPSIFNASVLYFVSQAELLLLQSPLNYLECLYILTEMEDGTKQFCSTVVGRCGDLKIYRERKWWNNWAS